MPAVCLYFQAHQPNRLKPYTFFEIGRDPFYEDDQRNREILNRVSERCYLPANRLMLELIEKHGGEFRLAFSISGVLIEQLEHHRPDVLESFIELSRTGCVEFLNETYYHSLCFRHSGEEFKRQVLKHRAKIQEHFGQKARVFRHTELIYFNELAAYVEDLGYDGILAEGVPELLKCRSPNALYRAPNLRRLKTLTRNFRLSDDLAFRFADTRWSEYPLTPSKFAGWVATSGGDVANIFLDYESIGEHLGKELGIFEFWGALPESVLARGCEFKTPSEAIDCFPARGVYDAGASTSWADTAKDISAWKGNPMQIEATKKILFLEKAVKERNDPDLLHVWSKLQTSDHFYYMSTKWDDDGEVHRYFSPYPTPYEGYLYFMNALSDLQVRLGLPFKAAGEEGVISAPPVA